MDECSMVMGRLPRLVMFFAILGLCATQMLIDNTTCEQEADEMLCIWRGRHVYISTPSTTNAVFLVFDRFYPGGRIVLSRVHMPMLTHVHVLDAPDVGCDVVVTDFRVQVRIGDILCEVIINVGTK